MIGRVIGRIWRGVAGVVPAVRRHRDNQAVLAVIPPDGIHAIKTAVLLDWPVEKAVQVLGRLEVTGHVIAVTVHGRRRFTKAVW